MKLATATAIFCDGIELDSQRTICIDFDGVIVNPYEGSFEEGKWGTLNTEAVQMIRDLNKLGYKIIVLTARTDVGHVQRYLDDCGIVVDKVTNIKPPAVLYIDDRACWWTGDKSQVFKQLRALER